jgi:hypothetical protein
MFAVEIRLQQAVQAKFLGKRTWAKLAAAASTGSARHAAQCGENEPADR